MTEEMILIQRLTDGEVLEGKDAEALAQRMLDGSSWSIWVQVAINYLNRGEIELAKYVLEKLVQSS